jgi:hypothetical protein
MQCKKLYHDCFYEDTLQCELIRMHLTEKINYHPALVKRAMLLSADKCSLGINYPGSEW